MKDDYNYTETAYSREMEGQHDPDAVEEPLPDTCAWREDNDPDFNVWHTACGDEFVFFECGPGENKMRYCCYCGKPLVVVPYVAPPLEDEDV